MSTRLEFRVRNLKESWLRWRPRWAWVGLNSAGRALHVTKRGVLSHQDGSARDEAPRRQINSWKEDTRLGGAGNGLLTSSFEREPSDRGAAQGGEGVRLEARR